jgi:hypothetical protein
MNNARIYLSAVVFVLPFCYRQVLSLLTPMNLHPSLKHVCQILLLTGLITSLLTTPASAQTREKTLLPQRTTTTAVPQSPVEKKAPAGSIQQPAQQLPPALPDIELSASPNPVQVGDVVTLTVRLKPRVVAGQENRSILVVPRVEYRYSFGDGPPSDWTSSSQMTHKYETPRTYRAAAQVRLAIVGASNAPGPVGSVSITVTPSPVVISPSPVVSPGSAVSPAVSPGASPDASASPSTSPGGSPSPSPSQSPSESPLDSPSPPAGDVAGQTTPAVVPTIDRQRPPEPARQIPWKILAIVLLAVLLIAYRIAKWVFAPRPTFSPQLDASPRTKMNCSGPEPSLINFEMLLNTNLPEGRYQFHTHESQLISYLRREQ